MSQTAMQVMLWAPLKGIVGGKNCTLQSNYTPDHWQIFSSLFFCLYSPSFFHLPYCITILHLLKCLVRCNHCQMYFSEVIVWINMIFFLCLSLRIVAKEGSNGPHLGLLPWNQRPPLGADWSSKEWKWEGSQGVCPGVPRARQQAGRG